MATWKVTCSVLFAFLVVLWAADLQAPEITGKDIFGFDPYRIHEDGSIVAGDGTPKGWVRGDTVYDEQWNVRYRIAGNKLCKVNRD